MVTPWQQMIAGFAGEMLKYKSPLAGAEFGVTLPQS
jgi:hypothetical protein